jgi:carboxypeptidase Taq
MQHTYKAFTEHAQKIADIHASMSLMHWDQEVYMPEGSASFRSRQLSTLSGIAHELFTDSAFGECLKSLAEAKDLDHKQSRNIKITLKEYIKATKFKKAFVMEKSRLISEAYQSWIKARKANDFSIYVPALDALIKKVREEADILGYEEHTYDALLDLYEPGLKVNQLEIIFESFKQKTKPLLDYVLNAPAPDDRFLNAAYPKDTQWDLGIEVLKQMGYDFKHGRQDVSPHPFTTSFSAQDVRVTTRLDEHDLMNMLMSCIHEGGHALYEQGLDPEEYGLPSGGAISLGIHESQSRLWENHVGRSLEFWEYLLPKYQKAFPKALAKVSTQDFYRAVNKVQNSPIRTEADELTYHFHVMIRYEIEKLIIEGNLKTEDIKEVWNEKYKLYLQMEDLDDNHGVLQDVHWAHGSFGYFPTYSIGSFYAAQFHANLEKEFPDSYSNYKKGDFSDTLKYLRSNIHQWGRQYEADELCIKITGESLNVDYFVDYANKKYRDIY